MKERTDAQFLRFGISCAADSITSTTATDLFGHTFDSLSRTLLFQWTNAFFLFASFLLIQVKIFFITLLYSRAIFREFHSLFFWLCIMPIQLYVEITNRFCCCCKPKHLQLSIEVFEIRTNVDRYTHYEIQR